MMTNKKNTTVDKYRLGAGERYSGLVKKITDSHDFDGENGLDEEAFEQFLMADNGFDLLEVIKRNAVMLFLPHLTKLNLICDYQNDYSEKPKRKLDPFKQRLARSKEFSALDKRDQIIAGLAADGLSELWQAECHAYHERYKMAAVALGRAMPIASLLQMMKMEHQWHNGQSYQGKNKSKAMKDRKPALKAIYVKLAKRKQAGTQPKELWPMFIQELRDAITEDGTSAFEIRELHEPHNRGMTHWFVTLYNEEKKQKEKPITYSTFRSIINKLEKK